MGEEATTAQELFDAIGAGYEEAFGRPPMVEAAVRELVAVLPPGARVLDVGSGTGRPVAEDLTRAGHRVTGLDVSREMVRIAREQVPAAEFRHVDVREWESEAESWDAVCAFFPFLQMTRAETESVLGKIAGWLKRAGGSRSSPCRRTSKTCRSISSATRCASPVSRPATSSSGSGPPGSR